MDKQVFQECGAAIGQNKKAELFTRILSGLVMAGAALGLTLWSPLSFVALVGLGAGLMCWEWRSIVGADDAGVARPVAFALHLGAVLISIGFMAGNQPQYALAALAAAAIAVLSLPGIKSRFLSLAGVFYAGFPALALVWMRQDPDFGIQTIIFIFLVVWAADIAAYAVGRTIGGPKLSPVISPNKTWSGMIGGLAGSALVGYLFALYLQNTSALSLALIALVLAFGSQIGDLTESALKRKFGTKDSSNLIPGHGGILDRVDGLIVAAVIAALIALILSPSHPGQALLIWASS